MRGETTNVTSSDVKAVKQIRLYIEITLCEMREYVDAIPDVKPVFYLIFYILLTIIIIEIKKRITSKEA